MWVRWLNYREFESRGTVKGGNVFVLCMSLWRLRNVYNGFFLTISKKFYFIRCGGGYPPEAWSYWVHTGLVTGGQFNTSQGCQPYQIPSCDHHVPGKLKPCGSELPTPRCERSCRKGYDTSYSQDKHFGKIEVTWVKHVINKAVSITVITWYT